MRLHNIPKEEAYPPISDEDKEWIAGFLKAYEGRYEVRVFPDGKIQYNNFRRDARTPDWRPPHRSSYTAFFNEKMDVSQFSWKDVTLV